MKKNTKLERLAKRHGIEVGDYILGRMAEMLPELERMRDAVSVDRGIDGKNAAVTRADYAREAADFVKLELELMPYFHAKKTTSRTKIEGGVTMSLFDVLKARENERTSGSD